jgi:hypothetical protein
MKLRTAALAALEPEDIDRWTQLRHRAIDPYPGIDPRVLVPAARTRDDAHGSTLLLIEDGDELLLLMPFVVETRVERFPLKVISSRDPFLVNESAWHFPLVDRVRAVEAFAFLLSQLTRLGLPGLIEFDQFPGDGPLWDALVVATAASRTPRLLRDTTEFAWTKGKPALGADASVVAQADDAAPSFVVEHSPTQTRRRRRQARALEQRVGVPLRMKHCADDPMALETFMDLQAAGWKGDTARGGKGLRVTHFDGWFSQVADNFRADDDLFIDAMIGGSDVIYMRVCLRVENGVFSYADAYDERFADFSPGALGRIACNNLNLHGRAASFFDPNMDARYVESSRLYSDRRPHSKILVAPGGPVAKAVVRALPIAKTLRDRSRQGALHA